MIWSLVLSSVVLLTLVRKLCSESTNQIIKSSSLSFCRNYVKKTDCSAISMNFLWLILGDPSLFNEHGLFCHFTHWIVARVCCKQMSMAVDGGKRDIMQSCSLFIPPWSHTRLTLIISHTPAVNCRTAIEQQTKLLKTITCCGSISCDTYDI